jgi:hypothetical protein
MVKDAAISVRVDEELKGALETQANQEGRSLASYVSRVLRLHLLPPQWILKDPQPLNWKSKGPLISLSVAEGWPGAVFPADRAESLGKQLIAAAQMARKLPPGQ